MDGNSDLVNRVVRDASVDERLLHKRYMSYAVQPKTNHKVTKSRKNTKKTFVILCVFEPLWLKITSNA
jgi:hypothetical protein